ncbi:parathyroid hormone-related protein-like [Periophthalmus magnuspinnatus]|uniref:parathyroid hormone-related protein-like n=1 Tax=Periophthalmus magnuspinnatus TaxID=409849 RepID=UPI002436BC62|nr:parathyroid hormone-related protein-like [Periophthalmus magnuspinnatus]
MLCTVSNLHQWSLALFLLLAPLTLYGRPFDTYRSRIRRSVSHAQLMHDKGRSLQELKRRLWIQDLLEKVHTAGESDPHMSRTSSQTYSGSSVPQKPQGATKDLSERFGLDSPVLPQETNKAVAYKDQTLKLAIKKKKKVRLGRRRESDKKRRKTRSVRTDGLG